MADTDLFGLKLQLQLDSLAALNTVDNLGESISNTEKQVSTAANAALNMIGQIASVTNEYLKTSVINTGSLNTKVTDTSILFKQIGDMLNDSVTTNKGYVKDLKTQLGYEDKIFKFRDKTSDITDEELKTIKLFLKNFLGITDVIKKKNVGHKEQLGLLHKEHDVGHRLHQTFGEVKRTFDSISRTLLYINDIMNHYISKMHDATKLQEDFVTNNYRAYGSMRFLAAEVRNIAAEYNLLTGEATAAYKALVAAKLPKSEIHKLAGNVGSLNRITGVSQDTFAQYYKRLRSAGYASDTTTNSLGKMSDMMRKLNINTQEMNALLSDTEIDPATFDAAFGPGTFAKIKEMETAFVGLAGARGRNAEDISKQIKAAQTDISALAALSQKAGMNWQDVDTAEEFMDVNLKAAEALGEYGKQLEASGVKGKKYDLMMRENAKAYGFVSYEAYETWRQLAQVKKEMGSNVDMSKFVNAINESMTGTQEFSRTLDTLRDDIKKIWDTFYEVTAEVLLPFLKTLAWVVKGIAWVVTETKKWLDVISSLHPIAAYTIYWVKFLIVGLPILAGMFIMAAATVASLFGVLLGIPGVMNMVIRTATGFGQALIIMARAVGTSIMTILQGIGQGLLALGRSVAPVMLPLLAVGAALMMVGIGAYFFAMSVDLIAQMGWNAIPAILGMITTIGILGLVLVGLGYLAMGAAPGLLALGAAFLMVGAGAYLIALAIQTVVSAFDAFLKILDAIDYSKLVNFAIGFAVSVGILAISSTILVAVGLLMITASVSLMAGAVMLTVASGVLIAAATILGVAAVGLAIGSGILLIGSGVLLASASMIFLSSMLIGSGSMVLLTSGGILIAASVLFIAASAALVIAGIALIASFGFMVAAGSAAIAAGASLLLSMPVLIAGVYAAYQGSYIVSKLMISMAKTIRNSSASFIESLNSFEGSIKRYQSVLPLLDNVSNSLSKLSTSFNELNNVSTDKLSTISNDIIVSAELISVGSDKLDIASNKLDMSFKHLSNVLSDADALSNIDIISSKINNFANNFSKLNVSGFDVVIDKMSKVDSSFGFIDSLDNVVVSINNNITEIEKSIDRLDSVLSKNVGYSVRSFDRSRADSVRANSINMVRETVTEEANENVEDSDLLAVQNELLEKLLVGVNNILAGVKDPAIKDTIDALANSLAMNNDNDTNLNKW